MTGPLKPDKWYEEHGVAPPEHIVHAGSDSFNPDTHVHKWQQQGNFLHCSQGQHGHGIPFDHVNKILVGTTAQGAPILEDIVLSDKVPKTPHDYPLTPSNR